MDRTALLEKLLEKEPSFRKKQLFHAIYKENTCQYQEISSLPLSLRQECETLGEILTLKAVKESPSKQACKMLFELRDSHRIETVRMTFKEGLISLCISSQVGCACQCAFCSTGKIGFHRHLTADEITDQILFFLKRGQEVRNVSFMGMGEPFLNPNLFDALDRITSKDGLAFSPRRLSISTVGIPEGMRKLTELYPQISLTFSLHTPFNEERDALIPLNKSHQIEEVFEALEEHIDRSRKKTYIAYLVLSGKNDSIAHAKKLLSLLERKGHKHLYHVNLIRYNGKENKTTRASLESFRSYLEREKAHVTIRQSFGQEIDAACGMLAANYQPCEIP